jgi:lysozyme family protein
MDADFERAFKFAISAEGGYVNDPDDPGGETKFGISKRAYPSVDIAALTAEQAKEIYRRDYWERAGCDALKWPLNILVFDAAVNQGVSFAREMAHECGDLAFAMAYRLKKYSAIVAGRPASLKYFRGWVNRVLLLHDYIRRNT